MKVDLSLVGVLDWQLRKKLEVKDWNRIDYDIDNDKGTIFIRSSFYINSHPHDVAKKVSNLVDEIKYVTGVKVDGSVICEKLDNTHKHLRNKYVVAYKELRRKSAELHS